MLIGLIGRTLRIEVEGIDYITDPNIGYDAPILCLWHDRIFAGTYYFRDRGLIVMSSISFDAEYTARCIQRFGFGVIKGSSTRGGTRALVEMIRLVKKGVPMAFTIDGPRGPRYKVKAGPALLAKRTGSPMLPFSIETKHWTLNSWDKAQIPIPFTRARVFFSDPIFVPPDVDENELEQKSIDLQMALDDLVKRGREWARQE
ncbi:MAG: lysophospholipid acyltransferase family protein [Pyrinomonadaceae bacterium]